MNVEAPSYRCLCIANGRMVVRRTGKRLRGEDVTEEFLGTPSYSGSYLKVSLKSNKAVKSKGWPWVQAAIRGVLGQEKVEKANFLRDGSLLVKTKSQAQTDKLLSTDLLMGEGCEVVRDSRLNTSKGTIHAYDLLDLSDDEIVQWLSDFGVVGAKRFTRRTDGRVEPTPTILLTFDMPTCPQKLELDYVTYHVKKHVPNPLMCYRCGEYGHPELRCSNRKRCFKCGGEEHSGDCHTKCLHCDSTAHSCRSRECPKWIKEKTICDIKVEHEVSYGEARRRYNSTQHPPTLKSYSDVVRVPSEQQGGSDLKEKVERLEKKIDKMADLIFSLTQQLQVVRSSESPRAQDREDRPPALLSATIVAEDITAGDISTDSEMEHVTGLDVAAAEPVSLPSSKGQKTTNKEEPTSKVSVDQDMADTDADDMSQPLVRRGRQPQKVNPKKHPPRRSWKEKE